MSLLKPSVAPDLIEAPQYFARELRIPLREILALSHANKLEMTSHPKSRQPVLALSQLRRAYLRRHWRVLRDGPRAIYLAHDDFLQTTAWQLPRGRVYLLEGWLFSNQFGISPGSPYCLQLNQVTFSIEAIPMP